MGAVVIDAAGVILRAIRQLEPIDQVPARIKLEFWHPGWYRITCVLDHVQPVRVALFACAVKLRV